MGPRASAARRLWQGRAAVAARCVVCLVLACAGGGGLASASRLGLEQQHQQHQQHQQEQLTSPLQPAQRQQAVDFQDGDDPSVRAHWALLVAGSAGWGNYRHQADVLHAYQLLLQGGYRADHIVLMAADDLAHDPQNPLPGKVFNRPGGQDLYRGACIDYRGPDVNADTFLAVLEGDTAKVANRGSGRVVSSGRHDRVFLFYSDHGAAGVLGMPHGPFLYADQLLKAVRRKFHAGGFQELVMYIEACESGSMFEGLLGDNMAAYVTTAANAFESSWATYCPEFFEPAGPALQPAAAPALGAATPAGAGAGMRSWLAAAAARALAALRRLLWHGAAAAVPPNSPVPPPQFTTCLGDLYSVAWMENAEASDLTRETLLQQYRAIKRRTSQNFSYDQGSHVMQYGDLDMDRELAGDYQGMLHNGSVPPSPLPSPDWHALLQPQQQRGAASWGRRLQHAGSTQQARLGEQLGEQLGQQLAGQHRRHVLQRNADLLPLLAAATSGGPEEQAALAVEVARRGAVEAASRSAVAGLLRHAGVGHVLLANLGWAPAAVLPRAQPGALRELFGAAPASPAAAAAAAAGGEPSNGSLQDEGLQDEGLGEVAGSFVEQLLGPLPGSQGAPLVESWDCLRGMVQAWEGACGALNQYGMKLTRLFANLCNAGLEPAALAEVAAAGPCQTRLY